MTGNSSTPPTFQNCHVKVYDYKKCISALQFLLKLMKSRIMWHYIFLFSKVMVNVWFITIALSELNLWTKRIFHFFVCKFRKITTTYGKYQIEIRKTYISGNENTGKTYDILKLFMTWDAKLHPLLENSYRKLNHIIQLFFWILIFLKSVH